MKRKAFLTPGLLLALAPSTLAKSAPVTNNNPEGVQFIAVVPNSSGLSGSVVASSTGNGTGVGIQVSIAGLPSQGGPFSMSQLRAPSDYGLIYLQSTPSTLIQSPPMAHVRPLLALSILMVPA
jgi:hypothetical protein